MRGWQRWWPVGAIAFAVLFIVTFFLVGDTGATPEDAVQKLTDKADQLLVGFVTSLLTGFSAIAFFAGLRDARHMAGAVTDADAGAGRLALGAAVAGAALLPASLALLSGAAESKDDLTPEIAALASNVQYPFLVGGMTMFGLAILVASLQHLRGGLLPTWLCWAGIVTGLLQLAAFAFFPMLLVVLWMLVAGIVLLTRAGTSSRTTSRTTVD